MHYLLYCLVAEKDKSSFQLLFSVKITEPSVQVKMKEGEAEQVEEEEV